MISDNASKTSTPFAIILSVLLASSLWIPTAYAAPSATPISEPDAVVEEESFEMLPIVAGLSLYLDAMNSQDQDLAMSGYSSEQLALIYDQDTYLAFNPDVAQAYGYDSVAVLDHFISMGMAEGRVASLNFDVNSYFLQYTDLRMAFGYDMRSYFEHYINTGINEGRQSTGFFDPSAVGDAAIRGRSKASVAQMAAAFKASGHAFPMATFSRYGASTIEEFCTILTEEALAEGVRAEVVFAQCMHETGWLQFYGDVSGSQCNFAGLGVYGGMTGAVFNDWGNNSVRKGLRAQIQHLMAYCSDAPLANDCVDPRFSLITRGCAPTVYDLGGKWAVPGTNYGNAIMSIIDNVLSR